MEGWVKPVPPVTSELGEHPDANVVNDEIASVITILVSDAEVMFSPTTKYAMHLPGAVFELAGIGVWIQLPGRALVGGTPTPLQATSCWYFFSVNKSPSLVISVTCAVNAAPENV
jgi:hypothetical protein